MKHFYRSLLLIGALALLGLACGLGGAATDKLNEVKSTAEAAATQAGTVAAGLQEVAETAAPQAATAAAGLQEVAETAAPVAATAAAGAGQAVQEQATAVAEGAEQAQTADTEQATVDITSVNDTLQQLDSYRAKTVMSFEGTTNEGKAVQGKIDMLIEEIKEPYAQHTSMSFSGDIVGDMGGVTSLEMYNVDNTIYIQNPEDSTWMSFPNTNDTGPFAQGMFTTDDLLDIPKTAKRSLLPQTVNGISTWHYTFTEKDFPNDTGLENASGEMWLARDGGYPVKFIATVTGSSIFGKEEANLYKMGTVTIEYELLDVNKKFSINLPDEAKNATSMGDFMGGGDTSGGATDINR